MTLPGLHLLAAAADPSLDGDIRYALTFVPTFAAVLIRVGAMFIFSPLFGSGRIPKPVKGMLAVVLAATLAPTVTAVQFPETVYTLSIAVIGELLFGLAMGMIMSIVFVAAQWAGEIIGQQLGFNLASVFDPQFGAGSVISDLLFMLTLTIFLCLNGHHAMLQGLHSSFEALPLFTAGIGPGGIELMTGLMMSCTVLVMKLIAPVIAAMLISDVVLGFVAKTMPQLNVMSVGTSIRSLLGLVIVAAGLVFTSETMSTAIENSAIGVKIAWTQSWKGGN